ncbi:MULTISPECIES: dynamin family protein [unclassified Aureispira]|uniref:dynamin family protein n=1 Tax=unclassified Aureispira TaxID=2649989 RepID=UPI0006962B6B|nr:MULTISPECIES: dynamin family protein [unclassified Aureispira]WMX12691.1 dynamin family protein [Aureispira sp. CCB-E]
MSKIEVSQHIKELKASLKLMGSNLLVAAREFGASKETREILKGQIDNINENFLFVIVGEVNAGKSSFVNALLGSPICATSHEICTQDVQKIIYGEQETLTQDTHERITTRQFPADILKEITVVDTPGTNSRELDHQVITERFIPKCNLVLFVFQLDNIHVQSAWDLFQKIKGEWSKKVVFVLTKADRYSEEEKINYKNILTKYAINENIENPLIYVTSSKLEDEGKTAESGFAPIRDYINSDVLKNAALNKIIEDVKVIKKLMADIHQEFDLRKTKFAKDTEARERIASIIKSKESLTLSNIQNLTRKCLAAYDANTEKTLEELNKGIGFFSFTFKSIRSVFGGESTQEWLEKVNKEHVERLNKDTNLILDSGVDSLKSDITYMVIGVKEELDALEDIRIRPTEMFHKIDEKRNEIVHSLKQNLTDFLDKSSVFKGDQVVKGNGVDYTGVNVAGGVAAVGGALTFITQISVLDITGGIATGLGLLLAGGIAFSKKGKYIADVKEALAQKRVLFEETLTQNLSSYFNQIKLKINDQFVDFDYHLKSEANQIKEYDKVAHQLKNELKEVERKIFS